MRISPLSWVPLVAAVAIGCAAHEFRVVTPSLVAESRIAFLEDGETTREAVYEQLGTPSRTFEHERILTYRLDHKFRVVHYTNSTGSNRTEYVRGQYSLILVFDDRAVLERYRVLQIR